MENYDFMQARTDTLADALRDTETLGEGLPQFPVIHRYPYQTPQGPVDKCAVYVSRIGLSKLEYGMGNDPVLVTQEMVVACQVCYPADAETMEKYVSYLSANVLRCLLANAQVTGDYGWTKGIVTGTDAVRLRNGNSTCELELYTFQITYEVDRT